jgi:tetraacyldisaccharide 4'-kinase
MLKNLVSKAYGAVVKQRNRKYDSAEDLARCSVPVISVGNLSAGGTGKTPFVQMLCKYLLVKKKKPGIVGRGYKRKSKGEIIVSDGRELLASAAVGGDEMVLLADTLKVPVIAHDSKAEAALSICEKFDINCVIVDDGFQHRALHRDLDIVIIDRETVENPKLLPDGMLREPLESLKRADVIALAGNIELTDEIKNCIDETTVVIRVIPRQAAPYGLFDKIPVRERDSGFLKQGIIPFAGIAKPYRFFDMLNESGFKVVMKIEFSDHHNYSEKDILRLVKLSKETGVNNLGTTEKDAAKLIEFRDFLKSEKINIFVFPIALHISEGKEPFFRAVNNLFKR